MDLDSLAKYLLQSLVKSHCITQLGFVQKGLCFKHSLKRLFFFFLIYY